MRTLNSRGMNMGEAFSAGLGVALGLVMGQFVLQPMGLTEKRAVKQVLMCQECAAQNPIENKFCGNCGQSLYPPPQITCQECNSEMPSTMKFCGYCGLALPSRRSGKKGKTGSLLQL